VFCIYGGGAEQLGRQLVAAGATFVFSVVATALLALLHAETAYDLHAATGGARPHFGSGTGTLLS
jgi:Amt family ammonium transporter